MKKSDLRTGMIVTTRNENTYYVMLNTGCCIIGQNDVLVHKVGNSTGWMPLDQYDENMCFHEDDYAFQETEKDDRSWDIVKVEAVTLAADLFRKDEYRTVWTRNEEKET